MGVTGLWTVLQPCARPIKIETLNKKRLAVDASIWIYQFLKAVRDKEGNALRNSHIVGFFRRICKLLYFGIKPVFVFDGGAPALKRQTISNRKSRREGRREDAVRTAGKLLALQMQRAAEEEEKKRKEGARHPREEPAEQIPEDVVYADEVFQTQQERIKNRKFKRKDQYHLPDLGVSLNEMGGPDDPRIMSMEELEEYARQFDRGEDINVYDFSKIDFDGPFFVSLPASDRYNILNAARLRSRLRMGYSKDQLDSMFPDRMAFSKFQIERVRERNELTQRLMNLNGMNDDAIFGVNGVNRVASEKSREYVLVRNEGAEGGWALGVVSNKDEGKAEKPIDVDRPQPAELEEDDWEDDDDFEDVPIEGLNRLPKPKFSQTAEGRDGHDFISQELALRRQKLYNSRKERALKPKSRVSPAVNQDPDSLFLAEENGDDEWENIPIDNNDDLFEEPVTERNDEEEQQLRQAIALSLQQDGGQSGEGPAEESEEDIFREVFHQERAKEVNPFSSAKGSGLAIARMANQRSSKLAPAGPFNESDSDDDMDLQAALAESRKSKRASSSKRPLPKDPAAASKKTTESSETASNAHGFDGPLPFEKLNLGSSILGKKKMQKLEEDNAGGFVKDVEPGEKKSAEPLPPWFNAERDIEKELAEQRDQQIKDSERDRKEDEANFQFQELPRLRKHETKEVIDLEDSQSQGKTKSTIVIDSDDEPMEDVVMEDSTLRMGDLADRARAEPPQSLPDGQKSPIQQDRSLEEEKILPHESEEELIEWSASESEAENTTRNGAQPSKSPSKSLSPEFEDVPIQLELKTVPEKSPSQFEDVPIRVEPSSPQLSKSPSPEFEDVPMNPGSGVALNESPVRLEGPEDLGIPIVPASGVVDDHAPLDFHDDDSDQYSDPEDAELFASLAKEAEEHERFAQELSNNTASRVNFDEELKQLRAQQKKDRRDADEVTQTMISECQHLLTLFGLPYVTAPMEAEAQCAELVKLGLVDGIITDDSDTFLFGGTRVYKNTFNAAKYVECYLANDLETEFALTREKLIAIAQLLGSDYTTGIPGIGPVTALEILSEFPNLQDFKDWWSGVQDQTIPKEADKASPFRRRFRRTQATKLFLPTNFPDPRVAEAYLFPEVDDDPQPFQWGVPDLAALRTFLSTQIGWSWERTDEVLVPVIRDMNRREQEGTQSNITKFFEGSVGAGAFAPRVRDGGIGGPTGKKKGKGVTGKRLGAALARLAQREKGIESNDADGGAEGQEDGSGEARLEDDGVEIVEAGPSDNRARQQKKRKAGTKAAAPNAEDEDDNEDELCEEPKKKARKGRKNKKGT